MSIQTPNPNGLKLQSLEGLNIGPMPVDDVGMFIWASKIKEHTRRLILTQRASKFAGNILWNKALSWMLKNSWLAEKFFPVPNQTCLNYWLPTLNDGFKYRHDRTMYPEEKIIKSPDARKMLASPADSYFNTRPILIKNWRKVIELYPELTLDLEKMIWTENAKHFEAWWTFMLFTLKPFHDHTFDYPWRSKVLSHPQELSPGRKLVDSTDLNFAKFISKHANRTIFDENHRVVTELLATDFNERYFYVEVWAVNVNSIEQDNCVPWKIYERWEQKWHFNFWSTVALLLPKKLSDQIYIPEYFREDIDTSTEVKRRNVLAVPHTLLDWAAIQVALNTKMYIYKTLGSDVIGGSNLLNLGEFWN